jgi:hypothetical protein
MIWFWKGDLDKTFSQNAARSKTTIVYYAVMWLICLPPFAWFLLFPFYEALQLNMMFRVFGVIAATGMLIAALIPETTGWKVFVHRYSAFLMAWCFVPLSLLISLSSVVSGFAKVVSFSAAAFMLLSALYMYRRKAVHPKLLILQGVYIAAFQISVIIAYYF